MGIRTSNAGGDFEKAPEGMRIARCYRVIDCGSHINPTFGKRQHLAAIGFELPTTLMTKGDNQGKPFMIQKRYTLSHHEKANLRIDLESWYGKRFDTTALDKAGGFDLEKLIGRPALLNIVHSKDGQYANISSINPLVEGQVCPPAINAPFVLSFAEFDKAKFASLSDKMQEFISRSDEYQAMSGGGADHAYGGDDEDIPV